MGGSRDGKVKIQFSALHFVGNYVCYLFLTNSNAFNGHQKPTTGTPIFERFANQQSQANSIETCISSQLAQQRFPRYVVLEIIGVAGWAAPPPQIATSYSKIIDCWQSIISLADGLTMGITNPVEYAMQIVWDYIFCCFHRSPKWASIWQFGRINPIAVGHSGDGGLQEEWFYCFYIDFFCFF